MNSSYLVYPMFAMFVLTLVVLGVMFRARVAGVKAGTVKPGFYKTFEGGTEPRAATQAANHFANLFQMPLYFHVVCLGGILLGIGGNLFLVLAWLYVACRCIHAWIHIGSNSLRPRMLTYTASCIVLLVMWVMLVFSIT